MSSTQLCTQDRHRARASFGAQEDLSNPDGMALKALKSPVLLHRQACGHWTLNAAAFGKWHGVEWSDHELPVRGSA